jgi:hypothetical protein
MGNQQSVGRTRSDTYTRYERDGEDGRYVSLDHTDSGHLPSFDERVIEMNKKKQLIDYLIDLDWIKT